MLLLDAAPRLFRLCNALGIAELVHHEITLCALDDVLDPLVLMAGSDDKAIALTVGVVVLGGRYLEGGGATILAAFADDLESILRPMARMLARSFDLPVDLPVHRLVARNPLVTSVHRLPMPEAAGSYTFARQRLVRLVLASV